MDNLSPSYLPGILKKSVLEDESSILQYGQEDHDEFYAYELPPPKPSYWGKYPTRENPER